MQLSGDVVARLKSDNSMRIMLFSAADPVLAPYAAADIAFPHQLEVRVNGDEAKSNFKGLKNKPGSTRPADITDLVRKIPSYNNTLQVTYALTQKASGERVNLLLGTYDAGQKGLSLFSLVTGMPMITSRRNFIWSSTLSGNIRSRNSRNALAKYSARSES